MATCPNCHQQIPRIAESKFCPFCGASISTEAASASLASPERTASEQAQIGLSAQPASARESFPQVSSPQSYVPWEDRERLGFLPAFSQTWSDSVFHPVEFFRRLPKSGNVGSALLYAILIGVTGGILSLFWQYLFWDSWSSLPELERMLGQEISRDLLGFVALLIPISTVIFVFIASVIYHVCLVITGSSRHGFEATLRGFCYSYGPYLFVLVPMCGGLIALIWQYILMVIAWRELHESTTGRVLLAVFLPLLLCCGAILVFAWSLAGWLSRFAQ